MEGVVERLAPYDVALVDDVRCPLAVDGELVKRAATLLQLMPGNQRRETIEDLVSPNDWERGRRAVDALIDSAFAAEDESGRLRRVCAQADREARAVEPISAPRPSVPAGKRAGSTPTRRDAKRAMGWLQHASRIARFVASSRA